MINEASKLSIAIDLIDSKIGAHMVKIRNNKNHVLTEELENEYAILIEKKEQILKGNLLEINNIIEENMKG